MKTNMVRGGLKRGVLLVAGAALLMSCGGTNAESAEGSVLGSETLEVGSTQSVTDIWTANDFNLIRNNRSGNFRLRANITGNGATWTPIGSAANPFTGTFRGSYQGVGYTISNFKISGSNTSTNQGFFGVARNALIEKLALRNFTVKGKSQVGGAFGTLDGSVVKQCSIEGTVTGNGNLEAPGADHGLLAGLVVDSTISQSYALGEVNGASMRIGGLAGTATGNAWRSTIDHSYTRVTVNPSMPANTYIPVYAGGIVGVLGGAGLENVYSVNDVLGRQAAGGLVGVLDGSEQVPVMLYSYSRGLVAHWAWSGDDSAGVYGRADGSEHGQRAVLFWDSTVDPGTQYQPLEQSPQSTSILKAATTSDQWPFNPMSMGNDARWQDADWDQGTSSQYPIINQTNFPIPGTPQLR